MNRGRILLRRFENFTKSWLLAEPAPSLFIGRVGEGKRFWVFTPSIFIVDGGAAGSRFCSNQNTRLQADLLSTAIAERTSEKQIIHFY
jgi:hypothetical protein